MPTENIFSLPWSVFFVRTYSGYNTIFGMPAHRLHPRMREPCTTSLRMHIRRAYMFSGYVLK
jgi:hypothetical protein